MGISYQEWFFVMVGVSVQVIIILFIFMRERRNNKRLIKDLKREKVKSKKYIEDLDNLLITLTRFQEMALAYSRVEDLEHLCNLIVEYATDLLQARMGSLMLINKISNMLEIVAAKGLEDEVVRATRMQMGEGIAGRVALEGKAIYCEDIEKDVRFMRHARIKYASKSFVSVPLKVKDKVIGVLNVNNDRQSKRFSERDIKLVSILAEQAAIAIENIQLYGNMKEMYLGTIHTLAKAIDAKDPYTRGHAERVAKYAAKIAREMDLPHKLVRNIEFAALIHDIGKIGVKDSVLSKPGKLSDSEYETIKKHPLIGEQILAPVEFLTNVAPLVLYHHEHYDGEGYLEGLKGEEIPVGARIINAADAYEAMLSDRPYSRGMTMDEAMKELQDKSGSQFDPGVVKAFLRILEREKQEEFEGFIQQDQRAKK
jgi:HD-GYP domain-containing protein (c-di-GMP phosphodiesterase class II)